MRLNKSITISDPINVIMKQNAQCGEKL